MVNDKTINYLNFIIKYAQNTTYESTLFKWRNFHPFFLRNWLEREREHYYNQLNYDIEEYLHIFV